MTYQKVKKVKKSVIIRDIDSVLYDAFKELTNFLQSDRNIINTKIYTEGIKMFLKKNQKKKKIIEQEMKAAISKVKKKHGLP